MARTAYAASVFLLWLSGGVAAQSASARHLTVLLPPGIASETVKFSYILEGSFGSHGEYIRPVADAVSYDIPITVDGKLADRILMVVYIPGCETRTYDLNLKKLRPRQVTMGCTTLPALTLTGRIQGFGPIASKPAELVVWYQATWECRFFGFGDCVNPQYEVARTSLEPDGTFQVRLPDFDSDPVVNSFKLAPGIDGSFRIVVRDPKTWNPIASLEPEIADFRTADGTLKVLSAYPSDLIFEPMFTMQ